MSNFQSIQITSHLNDATWQPAATRDATVAAGLMPGPAPKLGGLTFFDQMNRLGTPEQTPEEQARKAAAGLVSQALILPMLEQVRREASEVKTPFTPSNGENVFGTQFDQVIADHIANSSRMTVTNSLATRLMKAKTAAGETTTSSAATTGNTMQSLKTQLSPLHGAKAAALLPLHGGSTATLKPLRTDRWPLSRNGMSSNVSSTGTGVDLHG
jgi:Rod binding domain-containing protein